MIYDEEMIRAIRRKLAPDVMTALKDATTIDLYAPTQSVKVPLLAGVNVFHDKDIAAFVVDATIRDVDKDKWLGGRTVFSTREFKTARDKAEVIGYCFEQARAQMVHSLVMGELDRFFGKSA